MFKTEGVLAYKNLRRNKKKFRITLFSLVISVVIFISFSGFIDLFEKANQVNIGEINYDMRLWYSGMREKNGIVKELNNIDGINKLSAINSYGVETYINESDINKEYKDLIDKRFSKENKDGKIVYNFKSNGIDFAGDRVIKELELKTGSFDKESAIKENRIILRNKSDNSSSRKQSEISLTNYKVEDTINICKVYRDKNDKEVREPIKLKVLATTEDFLLDTDSLLILIYLESLLYGVLALLYGIPIVLLIDVYMNEVLGDAIEIGMVLPIKAVLISIVGVFVITFVSAYIPMKKINKENTIENIRQESI
ncbi:ABC transporter permease [Romboutsia sp. 1001216sp1]|uniref:ABC transporter permease n=1 Tax=unclassified Romboutsia TaxID=2626894 RepID=UPI00189F3EE0|nr:MULTISPECIES: ABC transporter permease [unclassified Romboutsia]MDB8790974.1 ABC transporter permease [Romboutsia sp. 1001216sp1]MDB8802407.1 ABC transporter permease [Romboutsia sp. 1001216sp1]MDB8813804.1 ABC transporter permease [Romboutsia sp. 1001216sp1]